MNLCRILIGHNAHRPAEYALVYIPSPSQILVNPQDTLSARGIVVSNLYTRPALIDGRGWTTCSTMRGGPWARSSISLGILHEL